MIWETYRDQFNRNRLKLSETETVNPRVGLTELTAPGPVTLTLSMPVSSPGTEASEKVKKPKYYHICPQTCLCILQFTPEMLY